MRRSGATRTLLAGGALGVSFACGTFACGTEERAVALDAPPPPATTQPPEARDSGVVDATTALPDAEAGAPRCSGDLLHVLAGDGTIAETCAPAKLCKAAKCETACDAAAAARGAMGCEFIVTTPRIGEALQPLAPCHALRVTNTSNEPLRMSLSRDGQVFDVSQHARIVTALGLAPLPPVGLPPGYVAIVFLSADPMASLTDLGGVPGSGACPVTPAVNGPTDIRGTGRGKAFRLRLSAPATVHSRYPYVAGTAGEVGVGVGSESLLVPTASWDTRYIGMSPHFQQTPSTLLWPSNTMPNLAQIIALEDGTSVTLTAKDDMPAGTDVAAAPHATPTTLTLGAGEVIQFEGMFDFGGSLVVSNKPVGLVAGAPVTGLLGSIEKPGQHSFFYSVNNYVEAQAGTGAVHAALLPTRDWGNEYIVARPIGDPPVGVPTFAAYVIVAAEADTRLAFDPAVPTAPRSLDAREPRWFLSSSPFSVKSQDAKHPFAIAHVDPGRFYFWIIDGSEVHGAPSFVPIPSADRLLARYEQGWPVARAIGPTGSFAPVVRTGVCSPLESSFVGGWRAIGKGQHYEAATSFTLYAPSGSLSACRYGTLESDAPFLSYVTSGLPVENGTLAVAISSFGYPGAATAIPRPKGKASP